MTTAKPPARYSAMESARSGDFAIAQLHHLSGHDLSAGTRTALLAVRDRQSTFLAYAKSLLSTIIDGGACARSMLFRGLGRPWITRSSSASDDGGWPISSGSPSA